MSQRTLPTPQEVGQAWADLLLGTTNGIAITHNPQVAWGEKVQVCWKCGCPANHKLPHASASALVCGPCHRDLLAGWQFDAAGALAAALDVFELYGEKLPELDLEPMMRNLRRLTGRKS